MAITGHEPRWLGSVTPDQEGNCEQRSRYGAHLHPDRSGRLCVLDTAKPVVLAKGLRAGDDSPLPSCHRHRRVADAHRPRWHTGQLVLLRSTDSWSTTWTQWAARGRMDQGRTGIMALFVGFP